MFRYEIVFCLEDVLYGSRTVRTFIGYEYSTIIFTRIFIIGS